MVKIIYLLFLFLSLTAKAQQNFFNIPSGQITPESKFFYQHQMNIYSEDKLSSKQHFVYGFGRGIEAGVNFINYDPTGTNENSKQEDAGPNSNILAATMQKAFQLTGSLTANMGTQVGLTHVGTSLPHYATAKTYGLLSYYAQESHLRLSAGPWVSGSRFNGSGDFVGGLFGFEWMFQEGYYIMADWISGNTQNSVSVIGGMIDLTKSVQLCLGYLIPNPASPEDHSVVLELNVFNF